MKYDDDFLPVSVGEPNRLSFYEAATDERDCGRSAGCKRPATTRIDWFTGQRSVACDEHAALARGEHRGLIARMSTWVPSRR